MIMPLVTTCKLTFLLVYVLFVRVGKQIVAYKEHEVTELEDEKKNLLHITWKKIQTWVT